MPSKPEWPVRPHGELKWTTAEGEEIPVSKLTDKHLGNIIVMLEKRGTTPLEPTPEVMADILDDGHIPYDSDGMDDMGAISALCDMQKRDTDSVWLWALLKERDSRTAKESHGQSNENPV